MVNLMQQTMRIDDVMSTPVVTAPTKCTLDAVARLMWEFDCGIVPIVSDDGRLAGVITDRDICMAAYTQDKPLSAILVTSAMTKQIFSLHGHDAIETAERVMRDNQIRRVLVIDTEHHPVGILAMNDIARLAAPAGQSGVDRELVETLASIGRPRAA
jgi:CBS domain-containing protein